MTEKAPVIRGWRMPVKKVKLGSLFGAIDQWHKAPGHRGTDFNGFKEGEPLYAVADGKIVMNKALKDSTVLGNVIVLQVGGVFFGYCHMVEQSSLKVGTIVKAGDIIGHAGNTGSASAGTHLHLTLGRKIDSVFSGPVEDAYSFLNGKIAEEKLLKAQLAHDAAQAAPIPVQPAVAPSSAKPVADAPIVDTPIAQGPAVDHYAATMKLDLTKRPKIKPGDKNAYVTYVQLKLGLKPTGVYDNSTKRAIVKLQKKYGFVADGVFGNLTWEKVINL